jgi:hypothetical protein
MARSIAAAERSRKRSALKKTPPIPARTMAEMAMASMTSISVKARVRFEERDDRR